MPADTIDPLTTPIGFAEGVLGMRLYPWQDTVLTWFEGAVGKRVKGSVCTPNGAGKDSIIIAALAIWWVTVHRRGRVVITSKDSRQIDEQTMPAIERHASKFQGWKFIDRYVETPTGGKIILFTTDEKERCEGFHRETADDGSPSKDGPLLIIVNEAKSVEEGIFTALDRCTYDGMLYASSPGHMSGRFYDSQFRKELGFKTLRVGLKDCPHIPKERIDDIIKTYGKDSAFARSTLDGEFMEAEGELRYDPLGLKRLEEMATAHEKQWRTAAKRDPALSVLGELIEQPGSKGMTWMPDAATGWLWNIEGQDPTPGCQYIGWCDPMTGEQSEGAKERDTHAAGILRLAHMDESGPHPVEHNDEVVAVLHHDGGCRWDNDILAERFAMMLKHWRCPAIVEANNAGTEVIRLLLLAGCQVWRRQKRDHRNPGKLLDVVGFQTNSATKNLWIGALGRGIREQTLDCRYPMATQHFRTFIMNERGSGEAQSGCHDDFVTGVGLGLYARQAASRYQARRLPVVMGGSFGFIGQIQTQQHQHGALA